MAGRSEHGRQAAVRDISQGMEPSPAPTPLASDCAEALIWTRGVLKKGLTQVYAVQLAECLEAKHHARLVEFVKQHTRDASVVQQIDTTLQALSEAQPGERVAMVEELAPIVFAGVDRVLEQAQAAGRDRGAVRLAAARFGLEVVILADPDPHQAWLLPTTQSRLRDALGALGVYPTAAETQELDLTQGETLQLLGYEFRFVARRGDAPKVQYKPIEALVPWEGDVEPARLGFIESVVAGLGRLFSAGKARAPRKPVKKPAPSRRPPPRKEEVEEHQKAEDVGRPAPVPYEPPAPETAEGRRRALMVRLRDWLPDWLYYVVPLPTVALLLRQWRWLAPALAVLGVVAWVQARGSVLEGTVTYQGRPVERGRVVVTRADVRRSYETPRFSVRIESGKFHVGGLQPGPYAVAVATPDLRTYREVTVNVGKWTTVQDLDLDKMSPGKMTR